MFQIPNINSRLFYIMAFLIIFMFLLNTVASFFYWYNEIWWFDMFMHTLGGAWVMTFLLSARVFFPKTASSSEIDRGETVTRHTFLIALLLLFLIVFAWEGFEYIVQNYTRLAFANPLDSLSDMFLGLSGGCIAFVILLYRRILFWQFV